jgi:tetratricopeptide (TPR) repeat protein
MLSSKDEDVLRFLFGPPASSTASSTSKFERNDAELASLQLEKAAVLKVEAGLLDEALRDLSAAVELYQCASAFNNRAQVLQLMKREDDAMSDVQVAIEKSRNRGDLVTLRQALCQRGMLLRVKLEDEKARVDFEEASALGCNLAKQQAALLNPHAQLCAETVQLMFSAFHKEK